MTDTTPDFHQALAVTRYLLVEVTFDADEADGDSLIGDVSEVIGSEIAEHFDTMFDITQVHPGDVVAPDADPTDDEREQWKLAAVAGETTLGLDEWVTYNRGSMD